MKGRETRSDQDTTLRKEDTPARILNFVSKNFASVSSTLLRPIIAGEGGIAYYKTRSS